MAILDVNNPLDYTWDSEGALVDSYTTLSGDYKIVGGTTKQQVHGSPGANIFMQSGNIQSTFLYGGGSENIIFGTQEATYQYTASFLGGYKSGIYVNQLYGSTNKLTAFTVNNGYIKSIHASNALAEGDSSIVYNGGHSVTVNAGSNQALTGNSNLVVNGTHAKGTAYNGIQRIFGGGYAYGNGALEEGANVTRLNGNANITINELFTDARKTEIGVILGGVVAENASKLKLLGGVVSGDVFISVNGGRIAVIIGGGAVTALSSAGSFSNVSGTANITLNGGTVNVIGGGGAIENAGTTTMVEKSNIIISGGTVSTNMSGIPSGTDLPLDPKKYAGNVYGGGFQAGSHVNNTTITISGGIIEGSVFGGGADGGTVGDTNITISGGEIKGEISGSGNIAGTVSGLKTLNFTNSGVYTLSATVVSNFDTINFKGSTVNFANTTAFANMNINITTGVITELEYVVAGGVTIGESVTFSVNGTTVTNGDLVKIGDDYRVFAYNNEMVTLNTVSKEHILVNAAWVGKQTGDVVQVGDKNYLIGVNAFADMSDAFAGIDEKTTAIRFGSNSGIANMKYYVGGNAIKLELEDNVSGIKLAGNYFGGVYGSSSAACASNLTVSGGNDSGVTYSGVIYGGSCDSNSLGVKLNVEGKVSAYRIYGGGLYNTSGTYTEGDIAVTIGKEVTLKRYASGEVNAGKMTIGDVVVNFHGTAEDVYGGVQAWYEGTEVTQRSVTLNFDGNASAKFRAAGDAVGAKITITDGVTVNVTGGSIAGQGLMAGGYAGDTNNATGHMIITKAEDREHAVVLNISGDVMIIHEVAGGAHAWSNGGVYKNTVSITGGTYVSVSGGARVLSSIYGGNYNAWGAETTLDTAMVVIGDATVDNVYGGSKTVGGGVNASASTLATVGSTDVTIKDGASILGSVAGGGFVSWVTGTGTSQVTGKASVKVTGGIIADDVVGGGYAYASPNDGTTGNLIVSVGSTEVTLTGGTINGSVYGGSCAINKFNKGATVSGSVTGNTNITISGGEIKGNVFGGSWADGANTTAIVTGSTNIAVTDGAISGMVFGGGRNSSVNGSVSITVSGGTVGTVHGGGFAYFDADSNYTPTPGFKAPTSIVKGDVSITINGGTIGNIYAGGQVSNYDPVNVNPVSSVDGNAVITINGGTVTGLISGDGQDGATVSGTKSLILNGGTLGGDVSSFDSVTINGSVSMTTGTFRNITSGISINKDGILSMATISGINVTLSGGTLAGSCSNLNISVADGGIGRVNGSLNDCVINLLTVSTPFETVLSVSGDLESGNIISVDANAVVNIKDDYSHNLVSGLNLDIDGISIKGVTSLKIGDVEFKLGELKDGYMFVMNNGELYLSKGNVTPIVVIDPATTTITEGIAAVAVGGTVQITDNIEFTGNIEKSCVLEGTNQEVPVLLTINTSVFANGNAVKLTNVALSTQVAARSARNETILDKHFFGGSQYVDNWSKVNEDCNLDLDDVTSTEMYVFGGAEISGDSSMKITGNVTVNVTGTKTDLERVYAGMFMNSTDSIVMVSGNSTVNINTSGSIQVMRGGSLVRGGILKTTGSSTITVENGVFASSFAGDSQVMSGAMATRIGDSTVTINGGTFEGMVAAGGISYGGSYNINGNTQLIINGGTFKANIYGGNLASAGKYGSYAMMTGDSAVKLNCNTAISLDGHIYAGSFDTGTINGNTSVTFSGAGSNLTFTGYVSGDSRNATNLIKFVAPEFTRSLVFDDFTGKFDAEKIVEFDKVIIKNSSVEWTTSASNMAAVKTWEFDMNQSADPTLAVRFGRNDFTEDTLNLFFDEADLGDKQWTVIDADSANWFTGLSGAAGVSLNGAAMQWNNELSAWSNGDYKLFVDTVNNDLKFSKIS